MNGWIATNSCWWFNPRFNVAKNTHNGNLVWIGDKFMTGCNIPAGWMFVELRNWYLQYKTFT